MGKALIVDSDADYRRGWIKGGGDVERAIPGYCGRGSRESEVVGSFAQPGRENRKLLGVLRTSRSVLLTREAVLALETPIYFPMALETPIYFPIVIETPIYFRKMPSGQKASLVFEACGG